MILVFNTVLAVVKVNFRANFHQAKCSCSVHELSCSQKKNWRWV